MAPAPQTWILTGSPENLLVDRRRRAAGVAAL
jgi:hypothetical protein